MRSAKIRNGLGEILARRGMSQTQLARIAGDRVTLVNHYCTNGIKTKRIAERYAAFLHCDPAELMDFSAGARARKTPAEEQRRPGW